MIIHIYLWFRFFLIASKQKKESEGKKADISEYSNIYTSFFFALNIKNIHGTIFYIIFTTVT